MAQKETHHQHLVPRCYLRNFNVSVKKGKKTLYFVDVFDKKNSIKGCFNATVENVCVHNDWYTFTELVGKDRLVIEDYFAQTIESEYPTLYRKLVEEKPLKLSNRDRHQIVKFCILQYFRTSKLTNQFNDFWGELLTKANVVAKVMEQPLKIQIEGGSVLDLSGMTIEEAIKKETRKNQEHINAMTISWALQQVEKRKNDIITVEKVAGEHRLITSDNPVYFFGNPFDSDTLIKMPLDHEHLLTIFPVSQDMDGAPKYYFSQLPLSMSEVETTFNNLYQTDKAERLIIGSEKTILESRTMSDNFDVEGFMGKVRSYTEKWQRQTVYMQKTGALPKDFEF